MTPILTDALWAVLHHLAAFALVAVLFAEWSLTSRPLDPSRLQLLGRLDSSYGALAALVLTLGGARLVWGAKGLGFYTDNPVFWFKLGCFALIGLLSIVPTVRILKWRRAAALPGHDTVLQTRRWMGAQLLLLPVLLLLATLMARGVGH